jgi:hypothetical protein
VDLLALQVAVDEEHRLPELPGEGHRQVDGGQGLPLPGQGAGDHHRVSTEFLDALQDAGAQHPVGVRFGGFGEEGDAAIPGDGRGVQGDGAGDGVGGGNPADLFPVDRRDRRRGPRGLLPRSPPGVRRGRGSRADRRRSLFLRLGRGGLMAGSLPAEKPRHLAERAADIPGVAGGIPGRGVRRDRFAPDPLFFGAFYRAIRAYLPAPGFRQALRLFLLDDLADFHFLRTPFLRAGL